MNEEKTRKAYEEQEKRISETVSKIKHRVAVFSGKGGVGKTTVSVNLAFGFHSKGFSVGLLDADITGPNVAKMLNVVSDPIFLDGTIMPFDRYGVKVISIASLIKAGEPVIWRGPLRSKMINQFLSDVEWGELDYLIADLPPGTGDEILTIAQEMKPDCAVVVTTPQGVSVIDAERAVNMAKTLEIPFICVVENMAGFLCPHCGKLLDIFGEGGGRKLAGRYNVPFLGSIPIDIDARILSDEGIPIVLEKPDCEVSSALKSAADKIVEHNRVGVEVSPSLG